ncbi:MAG: hypothetical protein CMP23_04550 [Rickettsiales bacterium]|nr:hypothetical protein [Rickettsiales bacterium]|tara:strand:- start:1108 stop:1941 length:834 start_codon:yes stop_codon:yes gene_type:complete
MQAPARLSPEQLIRHGWDVFKLRPWLCIAMFVAYSLTQPGGGGGGGGGGSFNDIRAMGEAGTMLLTMVLVGVGLMALLMLVLAGPIRGGYDLAMLRLVRGDQSVSFGDLFAGFSKFITLMLTMFLSALAVLVGLLLCVVPGVIVGLGLWPAYLLVMEDDLSPVDALKGAWALTDGYKGQLLVLALCNFVLVILGLLACCIGVFVAGPVAQLAWMGAYNEMRKASGAYSAPSGAQDSPPMPAEATDPTVGTPPAPALGPGDEADEPDESITIDAPLKD